MKRMVAGVAAVAVLVVSVATFSLAQQSVSGAETMSPAQGSSGLGQGGGKESKQRAVCSHGAHGSDGWASECKPGKQAKAMAEAHKRSNPDHNATVTTCED